MRPKDTPAKPDNVNIIAINTVATPVPTAVGGMELNLLILGLGSDNVMYKYDGASKTWSEQT